MHGVILLSWRVYSFGMRREVNANSAAIRLVAFCCTLVALTACGPSSDTPVGKAGWLTGSNLEKLDTVATHLRGNDLVMMEVDWRYQQLAKAGRQQNWEAAEYQLNKLKLTMSLGKERRPKRATSYDWFFETGFPPMVEAVAKKDLALFEERFVAFTQNCNTCHDMEKVSFFKVESPQN
jgi:hypothetical protein